MSGSPSQLRPSIPSYSSAGSSSTYGSGYSGLLREQGDQTPPSQTNKPSTSSTRHGTPNRDSQYSGSTHVAGYSDDGRGVVTESQDLVNRRHRSKKSGGFLLSSALPSPAAPATAALSSHEQRQRPLQDETNRKSKRSSEEPKSRLDPRRLSRHLHRKEGSVGRSPLSRELPANNDVNVAEEPRAQTEQNSLRSRGHEQYHMEEVAEPDVSEPPRPVIDPTQIVHMALNLSESRRRHLSAGQLLTPAIPGGRRVTSTPLSSSSSVPHSQSPGTGGSLRHYLQQQRRTSRNISPNTAGRGSPIPRRISASGTSTIDFAQDLSLGFLGDIQVSAATLARRDKAKAYFELAAEYRRLLTFLPPLKPDQPSSSDGTSNQPSLGREYNPIQYIRNRKVRARERKPLNPDADQFEDVISVREWVDAIEGEAESSKYMAKNTTSLLPPFGADRNEGLVDPSPLSAKQPPAIATAKSKPLRSDWPICPADLLADAYWIEQNSHKSLIENRHNTRIFPEPRSSLQIPRSSREYSRAGEPKRRSWNEQGIPQSAIEQYTAEDSDGMSDRGRRRRLFPKHDEATSRLKKLTLNRSPSSSDLSSDEEPNFRGRKKLARTMSNEENIGPLELQIKELLELEFRDGNLSPESVGSPDKWGFGHTPLPHNIDGVAGDDELHRGRTITKTLPPTLKQTTSIPLDITAANEPRSSFDEADSSAPNTPITNKFTFGSTGSFSAPGSRKSSQVRQHRKNRLSIFRSDHLSKKRDTDTPGSGAEDSESKGFRETFSDMISPKQEERSKSVAGHINVKQMLSDRATASRGSPARRSETQFSKESRDSRDDRDTSSAVARFFKTNRLAETIRPERTKTADSKLKKDALSEDHKALNMSETDPTETDEETTNKFFTMKRPGFRRSTTAETAGSMTGKHPGKSEYHIDNLPSFTSAQLLEPPKQLAQANVSSVDHIHQQQIVRKRSRSARFDSLAPPKIDLTSITNGESFPQYRSSSSGDEKPGNDQAKSVESPKKTDTPSTHVSFLDTLHPMVSSIGPWSITDLYRHTKSNGGPITAQDLNHIYTQLLRAGIVAQTLTREFTSVSNSPPAFIEVAAKTASACLIRVPRNEEYSLAARIFNNDVDNSTQDLQDEIQQFRDTATELHERIKELREVVASELTPLVHSCSDEADAFTRNLTGKYPLIMKELHDRAGSMMRQKRRKMRWLRRFGWLLLEWVLLGVMWWAWMVVVLWRGVTGLIFAILKVIKWFLWL